MALIIIMIATTVGLGISVQRDYARVFMRYRLCICVGGCMCVSVCMCVLGKHVLQQYYNSLCYVNSGVTHGEHG